MRPALHARARAVKKFITSSQLRFATANNYFPINLTGYTVTNNGAVAPQVEILQVDPHVIGADFTTLTPAITNQYLASNAGVKNLGTAISIIAMYVNYNGVTVGMTLSGATSATVADTANVLFDAMPSTLFGGAAKFAKGTTLQFRMHFRTTSPATQKFPSTNTRIGAQQNIYYDPRKVNVTNDVASTGVLAYSMKSLAITSASASGTTVTALLPDTSTLVSGTNYAIAGATGTGTALNYNGTFTITVVNGTTITYTAASAPSATATGSLTVTALNGTDANFGAMIPMFALGNHSVVTPVFTGDSKTAGTSDTATAIGIMGLSRALFANASTASTVVWPGCNFGCPSGVTNDCLVTSGTGSLANFQAWFGYGTHAIVGYGTNGFQPTQQQSHYAQLRAAGITKIIQRSLTPRIQTLTPTDPVPISALTSSGTAVTGTMADTSGLVTGQTYPISGATPAAYNGSFVVTVVNATTFTYTAASAPGSNATGTLFLNDQFRTTQYQTPNVSSGWSVGGAADTYEQTLRGWLASDPNLTYYQSLGERSSPTLGTAGYWLWAVNGTANYATSDGLHEGGTAPGYELNIGTAGTITTQAGGTVSTSLRAYVAALT